MKRLYVFIISAVIFCILPTAAAAETLGESGRRVYDNAILMSDSETQELETLIADMRSRHGMDFVVLTSYDAQTDESLSYADDFYDYNGFGTGAEADGFLFFIDMNNRVPTISTCGLMIRYVTDSRLDALLDTAYNYLADGLYCDAVYYTLTQLDGYIDDGIPQGQYNIDEYGNIDYNNTERRLTAIELLIAPAIGGIMALILFSFIKHRYALKGTTYKYDLAGNTVTNITNATDVYLRTNVVKTRRQSSSGGSGSSTHHSSSGRSHGGGSGRRF